MAALVAGLLAQPGDRAAHLAAILADRYARPANILFAAALALVAASLFACAAGALLADKLTPEAKRLFLALALLFQGASGLFPAKPPERLDRWRLGAFGTSLLGLFILLFGDGLQFIVLALAAQSALPWTAPIGAMFGALVVLAVAITLGERNWLKAPQAWMRRGAAGLFLVAGLWTGLAALRLV